MDTTAAILAAIDIARDAAREGSDEDCALMRAQSAIFAAAPVTADAMRERLAIRDAILRARYA